MDFLNPAFPLLVRAARALLGWNQQKLADHAGVSLQFITRIENLNRVGKPQFLRALMESLREVGIEFQAGPSGLGVVLSGKHAEERVAEVRTSQLGLRANSNATTSSRSSLNVNGGLNENE